MPGTMAEAFCKERLITWTEPGQDFTGWQDGDIYINLHGITQAGGITLFQASAVTLHQAMQWNGYYMTVTMFRDRSWMIHEEPTGGAPILVGTGEDEHRILDFIHQMREAAETGEEHEQPEFPTYPDTHREQWRRN